MPAASDLPPPCDFCEGTGLWPDPDVQPAVVDPCPLCLGSGTVPRPAVAAPAAAAEGVGLQQVLEALGDLDPAERQRLYEALHTSWGCRIYRS